MKPCTALRYHLIARSFRLSLRSTAAEVLVDLRARKYGAALLVRKLWVPLNTETARYCLLFDSAIGLACSLLLVKEGD